MNYVVYSVATGDIVAVGTANAGTPPTPPEGFAILAADLASGDTTFYVKDGVLFKRDPRPSFRYVWDGHQWQPNLDRFAADARTERNQRLAESDWTDTASAPARLGETLYAQWQAYRQALRDITQQPGFPLDVIWPTPPT